MHINYIGLQDVECVQCECLFLIFIITKKKYTGETRVLKWILCQLYAATRIREFPNLFFRKIKANLGELKFIKRSC